MIPAVVLGVGMFYLPETPRWLYENGFAERAREVLRRTLAGDEAEVEREIEEIEEIRRVEEEQERVGYEELLQLFIRPALIIGVGLAIFQQITGINTVIYYAPTTLEAAGFSPGSAIVATSLGVGVVNVGFTILAVWLMFVYFLVPETKGKTLEEIEADFRGTPVAPGDVG